jgi:CHAD domain-containing protein
MSRSPSPGPDPLPAAPEARQTRAGLVPGQPAGAALCRLLSLCAADFDRHRAALMASDAPEGPHGARVALRRLRTALLAFAPVLRRRPAHRLEREARALFRRLGHLRDADVLAEAARNRPEGAALAAAAGRCRAEVRAALEAAGAAGFAGRVDAFVDGDGWRRRGAKKAARGPIEAVAAAALDAAWGRLQEHGKRLDRMPVEERHAFRKDLKALRYQTDFFAALWPGRRQERFQILLKVLQDDLGVLNDLALAERQIGPGAAAAQGATVEALRRAAAGWRRLRRRRPWWHAR